MSSSILNIGVQALNANKTALSYVGQNIANVNTEGYSRQTVQMTPQDPPLLGVQVNDISRVTDKFLVTQVWSDTSSFNSNEAFSEKIALLDNMLVSESTSLSSSMDSYFASLQQVVDDPLYIANRELFLAEAQSLSNSFNDFDDKLRAQTDVINTEIRSMIDSVNAVASNIASLNVQIGTLESSGQNSNELQDKRDLLVKELSSYLTTNVISPDGGRTYNIIMGDGQPLVIGSGSANLQVRNSDEDPTKLDIYMTNDSGVDAKVTNQLGEGAVGGLVNYRDNVLQPTISEVGRLALVFSETMNAQHRKGMDLNGDFGEDLFADIRKGDITAHADNKNLTARANVGFYDVSALTASDYTLEITGVDSFSIVRKSDGARFSSSEFTDISTLAPEDQTLAADNVYEWDGDDLSVSLDGMTVRLVSDTPLAIGDTYLVQPTRSAAQKMDVEITNPRMLALASPLRVEPSTTNSGNAEISGITITNAEDTSALRRDTVTLPLELVFNAPAADGEPATYTVYDVSDPDDPQVFNEMEGLEYVPGEAIFFEDYEITIVNDPQPGDRFTIEKNVDGYSDNTNALAMSDLQNEPRVEGFSYQDTYGQMLAWVGTQASTAQIAYESSKSVLSASENALQSVSGVNLDEEAANLVKYQQAYAASAQMISAYQTIFDSLISAVRR
ncbi:flagellar hook-associated protein FlgK [Marinobacterium litorale]|uniref:flagellar hook-associated protein FlgK n=1 Tax=Marinobacterium litorale TaxID=404770 RepID=UPI0003FD8FD6|nr:flagellar hook-associated protein FlgK [Marinobacterium litorale]